MNQCGGDLANMSASSLLFVTDALNAGLSLSLSLHNGGHGVSCPCDALWYGSCHHVSDCKYPQPS